MLLVYLLVAVLSRPPAGELLHGLLVPQLALDGDAVRVLVAVLGTTISPYLLFWQSAHRIEDLRDEDLGGEDPVPLGRRRPPQARRKLRAARLDVVGGMLFSNVVMLAIMVSTATTLHADGVRDLSSAAQTATALEPAAGAWSTTLFALGFIGTGPAGCRASCSSAASCSRSRCARRCRPTATRSS